MKENFGYFTFSIFIGYKFEDFVNMLKESYKTAIEHGKVQMGAKKLNIEEYFDPISGANMEDFVCWENDLYKDMVFFASKQADGLNSLCYVVRKKLQCAMLQCALSNKTSEYEPMYRFHFTHTNGDERIIMAYKEDRWVFYQSGIPLSIENVELYKNRMIKNRINNDIIKDYLLKLNINLSDIDKNVQSCMALQRIEWGDKASFFQPHEEHIDGFEEWE